MSVTFCLACESYHGAWPSWRRPVGRLTVADLIAVGVALAARNRPQPTDDDGA